MPKSAAFENLEKVYSAGAFNPAVTAPMVRAAVRAVADHLEEIGSPIRPSLELLKGMKTGIVYVLGLKQARVVGVRHGDNYCEVETHDVTVTVPLEGRGSMAVLAETILAAVLNEPMPSRSVVRFLDRPK